MHQTGILGGMARRHLTLTLTLTLDEDTVRDADPEHYEHLLDALRTAVHHAAFTNLDGLDPIVEAPEVVFHGVTYES